LTHPEGPLTERRYLLPFILVTSLFFLWALGVNLNDILIPHLKKAFNLTDTRSSLIQVAFFSGYCLAALPAGLVMERVGYKTGILMGLLVCATGAALFIPAASIRMYGFFLFALFVMACGQSFLEVAANPYVTILGPPESSARRLNLAQSFNAVGAMVTPFIGATFILSGIEYSPSQFATMSPDQMDAYRINESNMVRAPYLVIAGIFLAVAVLIYFSKLPESRDVPSSGETDSEIVGLGGIWKYRHLVKGVIAQFCYVGAQVGVASFIIRFAEHSIPGTHEKMAAHYLQMHLFGFMLGRFAGSAIMKVVAATRLLSIFAAGALVSVIVVLFAAGAAPVWAVVLIGFFHSIMFPTIFALSIKKLGPYTKLGSSLLVMSIIGGAICPAVMGVISDASNIQKAFVVPLLCYVYVLYFALWGYKPVALSGDLPALPVESAEAK
jgi:FHS family L-fucose permease-like MFS transporter